ncbi:MAG: hypothetical protein JWQ35_2560 [Bacteriovoracaceae bacterium]|nr:hypothetical protein [Bacteriovoracaceae bacterium]
MFVNLEEKKVKDANQETKGLILKGLAGLGILSVFFWPTRKKAASTQMAQVKVATHSVPRAKNQSGRLSGSLDRA